MSAGLEDAAADLRRVAPPPGAEQVEEAAARLAGVVDRTPLQRNARLSAGGAEVWLKREDLQVVRSYKVRGAYNVIAQLGETERARGVVCASAGNHGQGLAYACAALGVQGRVFLPRNTPRQKRERIDAIGGDHVQVVVTGATYDEAAVAAAADAVRTGATVVPAFDDLRTIAGQGTVALEVVEQLREQTGHLPDVLVVPVGGGGLLAGCLAWLRQRHPGVRVVGVEPQGAASVAAALAAGHPVDLLDLDTFVDGASVRRAGALTTPVVAAAGAELVQVPEGAVCVELLAMYAADGIVAEPAGALASTALTTGVVRVEPGQRVVCVLSGGNNDVSRYDDIAERAAVHEGRKHYFLVEFPQQPGALRHFLDEVLGPDDDITLFEYVKRSNRETGPALVGVELTRREDLPPLLERMAAAPVQVEPIPSDSPMFRFLLSG
ncbi:threonine ammonia-lyase IlvA [Microlunatus flavus]|uniref:threonine ammonia-lyase IlvA n=1 Tax=Microlunatus flavus TaxID=1036181 RepID=UPI001E565A9C|nr:threonine ammonia-lyase IlvA [Microlunatus flavus]